MRRSSTIIAGYASLFGVPDLVGDVVHAGAFRRSISQVGTLPIWVEHDPRLEAGVWQEHFEDGRGLFVRGEIQETRPGAALALRKIAAGVDGLSIGFRTNNFRRRIGGGRDLYDLTLLEVSIVRRPMAPRARFWIEGSNSQVKEKAL